MLELLHNGTDNAAIALTATAGGITATVADGKDLTLGNADSDAYFKVAASASAGSEDVRIVNTNGTDQAAIAITASAGGVDIDAAAAKDVNIAGGQVSISSKDNSTSAISLSTNQGSSETIVVTNTQGTSNSAIALTSTAGGITAKVADGKDLTLGNANSDAYFKVAANSTSSSEDVKMVNTNGTSEDAITIKATSGGIDMDAASSKDINIAGGQVKLVSKGNTTSAISLTTNIGSSETIAVTNNLGTANNAISITSSSGGMDLTSAKVMDIKTIANNANINIDPNGSGTLALGWIILLLLLMLQLLLLLLFYFKATDGTAL